MVWLGSKPITKHSAIQKDLSFWWRRQSTTNPSIFFIPLNKRKINFSFLIDSFRSLNGMDWLKKYYNSNLYEADSYLVIIIECFCEEWTNTWNWLRGELVAELPKARGRRREWTNKEKTLSFWFVEWMSGSEIKLNERIEWNFVELRSGIHEINCFSFLFAGGYGRWHRQWLRQEEKTKEKQLIEWMKLKTKRMNEQRKLMKAFHWMESNLFDEMEGNCAINLSLWMEHQAATAARQVHQLSLYFVGPP